MTDCLQILTDDLHQRCAQSSVSFHDRVQKVVERTSAYVLDDDTAFEELEGCEKSIFGVKFEKRFTAEFGLPRKRTKHSSKSSLSTKLDTVIAGYDIDIKTTLGGRTWMIPKEARNEWCLLLQVDYRKQDFSLGFLHMSEDRLTLGVNQDKKASVNAEGIRNIGWLIRNQAFSLQPNICYEQNLFGSA